MGLKARTLPPMCKASAIPWKFRIWKHDGTTDSDDRAASSTFIRILPPFPRYVETFRIISSSSRRRVLSKICSRVSRFLFPRSWKINVLACIFSRIYVNIFVKSLDFKLVFRKCYFAIIFCHQILLNFIRFEVGHYLLQISTNHFISKISMKNSDSYFSQASSFKLIYCKCYFVKLLCHEIRSEFLCFEIGHSIRNVDYIINITIKGLGCTQLFRGIQNLIFLLF